MICYRDTTFCASPNCKNECGRQLTDQIKEDAERWWSSGFPEMSKKHGAPIAMSYFCGKPEDE